MPGINKAVVMGYIGNDVELNHTKDGKAVVNLSIATSDVWISSAGERKEATEWHKVTVFGSKATVVCKYCLKGDRIYLQGKLKTNKWNDNGCDKYSTEIIVDDHQGELHLITTKKKHTKESDGNGVQDDREISNDDDLPF